MKTVDFIECTLNEQNKVVFCLEKWAIKNPEYIFYDTFTHIFFIEQEKRILLTVDTLYHALIEVAGLLRKGLKKELFFDEKKHKNLGYLYNEYGEDDNIKFFAFEQYDLWSPVIAKGNIASWIYNDQSNNIILLLAPLYPFAWSSKRVKNYVSYNEWIKTYTPFKRVIINPDCAKICIKQAEKIIKMIHTNAERES